MAHDAGRNIKVAGKSSQESITWSCERSYNKHRCICALVW